MQGGVIQHISANQEIDIILIDFDRLEAHLDGEDKENLTGSGILSPDTITSDFQGLYTDNTQDDKEILKELKELNF